MPQATNDLKKRWLSDGCALSQLGKNFTYSAGIIRPVLGYTPTADDISAIDYLFQEWDYGYEPAEAVHVVDGDEGDEA